MNPVLIIASTYPPENVIGALRPARFTRYLPQFGYDPIVVTASPQSRLQPNISEVPFHFGLVDRVLRKTLFPCDERMTWISPALNKAEPLIRKHGIRLVFSTSPPISVHMVAAGLKSRFGIKWVADFRDAHAGNYYRAELANRLLDPWIEGYIAKRMDVAILNTDAQAERWKRRHTFMRDRSLFLFNGFDPTEEIGPLPLPLRHHQVWLHAGSIYIKRYPERLFASLERLINSKRLSNVRLHLLGEMPPDLAALPAYRNLVAAGIIESNPKGVPQPEARRHMAEADGLIVFDHYNPTGNLQIPAKTYEYIRIGRPILAFSTPGTPLDRLLKQCGVACTIIYEDDPPETIDQKLAEYSTLSREPKRPSDYFLTEFNAVNQTKRLAEIFDGLLKEQQGR